MINYQAFLDYLTNLHDVSIVDEIKKELIRNHEEFMAKFEADAKKFSEYFQDKCLESYTKQQENDNGNNT